MPRMSREKFRHADALNGFSESHVIRENGASGAGREGDYVQLIW